MRKKSGSVLAIAGIVVSILAVACGGHSPYSKEVTAVLEASGKNRIELEKVLSHYADAEDTLKAMVAEFLIANMEGHGYATYRLLDTAKAAVDFNVLNYADFATLESSFDSLEKTYGTLDFKRDTLFRDIDTITAEFLITQIDYAFRAWREKPWATGLSFDDFCNYVLPYRGSNEPLESWRESFFDKYKDLETSMTDPTDPVEAARLINNDIKSWFTFDPRFYYHTTDQGLAEMMENKAGRCEDMTNLTIYAMRANGLAITSDYTPFWANTGNNHAWNAIVIPSGKVIPFMGAEQNPGEYSLSHRPAKVYRKTYAAQLGNLVFQDRKQDKIAPWLAGKNYIDVTADYVATRNETVTFNQPVPDSIDIAYLCVFNSGEWNPIDWARIKDSRAEFTDIGNAVAYLPALYINEEIKPWGNPFLLPEGKARQDLTGTGEANTLRVETITDGIEETPLVSGTEYELYYWSDGWQSRGTKTAGDMPLVFQNIPSGALYWLKPTDSKKEERIFTIDDGHQVWW